MHDSLTVQFLEEWRETNRILRQLVRKLPSPETSRETNALLRQIVRLLRTEQTDDVTGGYLTRIQGDSDMSDGTVFPTLTPGTKATFQVAPTFSGAPFQLDLSKIGVTSSDVVNFPVAIDPTDPTGTIIVADIPASAAPVDGSEDITIDWSYTNADGIEIHITGTVTELGIVDDVTGGTFTRLS